MDCQLSCRNGTAKNNLSGSGSWLPVCYQSRFFAYAVTLLSRYCMQTRKGEKAHKHNICTLQRSQPKSILLKHTVKYMGLITLGWHYFFTSSPKNNACLAWCLDEVLPSSLPGYRCVRDLLCDLVSCNLQLLIRRLQKGWNERRSD